MLTEETDPIDCISVRSDGTIEVREATYLCRDGVRDQTTKRYHRYVLHPEDGIDGKDKRIADIAKLVWSKDVIASYRKAVSAKA